MKKKELLQLIQELQQRVALLEAQVSGKQDSKIFIPSVWPVTTDACVDGGAHDYPFPWNAVTPPSCRKCGRLSHTYTITCSAGSCEKETCVGCGCKL